MGQRPGWLVSETCTIAKGFASCTSDFTAMVVLYLSTAQDAPGEPGG